MANIQTINRLINVKETIHEVYALITKPFFEVTEDTSFYGEMSEKTHKSERTILINLNHVVEIQP